MSTYQELYDRVGSQIGWDFSSVKTTKENVKWQLYDLVAKHASTHPFLLDLGAGGGHRLLKIADQFSLVIGIDSAASMIKTAHKNLKKPA